MNGLAGAAITAGVHMEKSRKVKRIHQNILVFYKPF
jgi:hypothetical protein